MRRLLLTVFFTIVFAGTAFSQFYTNQYRPFGQNWQQLQTDHFRIIYPAGAEEYAWRSAKILELQYPGIQELVGGELNNFPVILNSENDRSNGFVNPFNFRSEIELPPIKGKTMNPSSGDWLELVLPHELVHALHMNVNPFSLTSVVGLISPDMRRSVHAAAPLGIFEGIAVEHESHGIFDDGGRGNYPFFMNRFHSNFASADRWSMGQLVHTSTATLPFDRHYIGSYVFIHWLHNRYGDQTLREAIEYHYKYPFLGFGFALKKMTGSWPGALYSSFEDEMETREENRLSEIDNSTDHNFHFPDHGKKGPVIRRPQWIDESTILFHGSFYNAPTGFYSFDLAKQNMNLELEHRVVEDYRFSYDRIKNQIFFSDYVTDSRYDNTFKANLFQYNLKTGSKFRLTEQERLFAPAPGPSFLALQTDGSTNGIVELNLAENSVLPVTESLPLSTYEEVQQHSNHDDLIAVIARKGSIQGLWIVNRNTIADIPEILPDVVFQSGSIFDLDWHPVDKKLLFSGDPSGTLNVYEYDLINSTVSQITQSYYNAFEAAYSPDGNRIAYIIQDRSRYLPAILEKEQFYNRRLPKTNWQPSQTLQVNMNRPLLGVADQPDTSEWVQKRYQQEFSWLKPRTILPYYNEMPDGTRELGLEFHSTDPLQRHSYSLTASGVHNRLWLDLDYRYSGFHPGFEMNLFNRPSYSFINTDNQGEGEPTKFLQQNRGMSFSIPFTYYFERNTRFTSLSFTPEYRLTQLRFFNPSSPSDPVSSFGTLHSLSINTVFNYRIRQFVRDFQPNAGWVFFARAGADLNNHTFDLDLDNTIFQRTTFRRKGLRFGIYKYLAPLGRWNQSLRIGTQFITQTIFGRYNTEDVISNAFRGSVFAGVNNVGLFDTRYTIPLAYPDDGGFLIPVYLGNLYLVLFNQTVGDLNLGDLSTIVNHSRTAVGAGLRTRLKLSNFALDIGIGFGYEPSRNEWSLIIGQF
jgi:hypothetical protein